MNDRPDFDPEKNFEAIRKNWDKKPSYFVSELEALDQRLEANLELINEQLSALFQLATKALSDSMDATIDTDYRTTKFADIAIAIANLQIRIEKLETR